MIEGVISEECSMTDNPLVAPSDELINRCTVVALSVSPARTGAASVIPCRIIRQDCSLCESVTNPHESIHERNSLTVIHNNAYVSYEPYKDITCC